MEKDCVFTNRKGEQESLSIDDLIERISQGDTVHIKQIGELDYEVEDCGTYRFQLNGIALFSQNGNIYFPVREFPLVSNGYIENIPVGALSEMARGLFGI